MNRKPKVSRPYMPEYGIADAKGGKGLLPWSWANDRLKSAPYYWVSTVRTDGRPHSMPVWAVFVEDILYFSTGRKSRKSRNLVSNPRCAISVQSGNDAVILEGTASEVQDSALIKRLSKIYNTKYKMPLDPNLGPVYAVQPSVVFGLIGTASGDCDSSDFTDTATRWRF